jgi:hypothetical protein
VGCDTVQFGRHYGISEDLASSIYHIVLYTEDGDSRFVRKAGSINPEA